MFGKGRIFHFVKNHHTKYDSRRKEAVNQGSPHIRTIVPMACHWNGVLDGLLEGGGHRTEKKFGKHFASIGRALSILRFERGNGVVPHSFGPCFEIVDVDLFEVLKQVDLGLFPFVGVACIVVCFRTVVLARSLVLS